MTPGAGGGQLKYLTSTPYTQHAADQFQPPLGLATPSPYQVVHNNATCTAHCRQAS